MQELVIAAAPLALLAVVALVAIYVPLIWLAGAALSLMAVGFAFGVPSGLYYHVLLRRALLRRGELPKGWYWSPQTHHEALNDAERTQVRLWFVLGAAGFALIVFGFLLSVLTLM